ncbi:hypothetical protein Nans01_48560 [Nocardiopsis ansamitocini]|uniref:Uncharacterized protein n=1 Tax=Nocardiopsis ansamitocini TaxID=1670832 RepID=A0A9W6PB98_9ACTN|nr:hypothetical protein Nans01_48560 [Nocardiopsis ansamitocini]
MVAEPISEAFGGPKRGARRGQGRIRVVSGGLLVVGSEAVFRVDTETLLVRVWRASPISVVRLRLDFSAVGEVHRCLFEDL